ncbi:hypothetical protein E3O42_08085 [Cryobacterium adonitolivorans]|uniref:Alpha/beta hydrolase n=1 Tax=Cryobacterium adonitolivorans TaxID=1259189 RepID=A0A4R8W892_9MICO|nr:hypothetical protein [Cryobacterium adonitolivorans]TFC02701.1 hypothetical protein E3O42_08085 [Cryobacterium adonitolivorans]
MTGSGPDTGPAGRDGTLTVSGGGSIQVATDTVFAEMAALRLLQGEAQHWQGQLGRVRSLGVGPAPRWQPDDLGACVFGASVAIDEVADRSRRLADALEEAAEEYGRLESGLDMILQGTGSWLAHTLGVLAPVLVLSMAAPLAYLAAGSLLSNAALGRSLSVVPPALTDWLRENPRLLTNPATVTVVRALVGSADDAVLGRLGVPYPVAAGLGDAGAGLLGAQFSAFGLLVSAQAAGMLRESPVRVTQVAFSATQAAVAGAAHPGAPGGVGSGRPAVPLWGSAARSAAVSGTGAAPGTLAPPSPPTGFADLADRIPTEDDGGQVRIERYGDTEHPSWLVYVGGTVEWSPTGSTEPWDMASNVAAVADQEAGSYRAVLQAMQAAGVQPEDQVVPVAHSQGGLIANQLVSRGDINAVAILTFGAPETDLPLPNGLPAIAVEHDDDIVPALGPTSSDDQRLYVRREFFAGREVPVDEAMPAHQLVGYRETARLVDESPEPRLVAFRSKLEAIVGTTAGQQSVWRGDRVD